MMRQNALRGLVGLAVLLASAQAMAAQRAMVILEEMRDGQPVVQRMGEVKLGELLTAAGVKLTEAVETEKARTKVSVSKILGGAVGGAVTVLNTDVLIVGRIGTVAEDTGYDLGGQYKAATARWTVKAVKVADGRVLATKGGNVGANGTNPLTASDAARVKAAEAMYAAIKDVVKGGISSIALVIKGAPSVDVVQKLKARLAKAKGVVKIDTELVTGDITKLDVKVKGSDAYQLAAAFKRLSGGVLVATSLSSGEIKAKYNAAAGGRKVVIAQFQNKTGLKRQDWLASTLPEVFETEIYNSRYLAVQLTEKRPQMPARSPPDKAKAAAKAADADLVVAGKIDKNGPKYRIWLNIYKGDTGRPVAAINALSDEPGLIENTKKLVTEVDKKLFEALFKRGDLEKYEPMWSPRDDNVGAPTAGTSGGNAPSSGGSGPRLRVIGVDMANLYPARLPMYATRPFGRVRLKNPSKSTMRNVKLRLSIPTVAGAPSVLRVEDIGPGEEATVPLTMVLDRTRVLGITQNTPARAELVLTYTNGKGEVSDAFTNSLVVFDKNAIDWGVSESVAAFVTHKAPAMEAFAASALRSGVNVPASFPKALRQPMLLFEAMASLPLKYQKDSENPYGGSAIDSVAYPQETLARKAGDCDDLSALYAALVQSQGGSAQFVLTPGHIFVAVDTGVSPAKAKARLGLDPKGLIARWGTVWVPVEVTQVGKSFAEAVKVGMAEVMRHRGTKDYEVVDIRTAWKTFPPFAGLPSNTAAVKADRGRLQSRVQTGAKAMQAAEASAGGDVASKKPDTVPVGELNTVGVRYAERGMLDKARDYFKRGKQAAPEKPEFEYNLANVYVINKNYDQAELAYRRLESNKKWKKKALHGLAVVSYMRGQRKAAASLFKKAKLKESKRLAVKLKLVKRKKKAKKPKPKKKDKTPKASGGSKKKSEAEDDEYGGRFIGVRASGGVDVETMVVWAK